MSDISQRRICWPNPDATCLEGGCIHCNEHPFRTLGSIMRYAWRAGTLPQRAQGEKEAWDAYRYGYNGNFYNAETR